MQKILYPQPNEWPLLTERPHIDTTQLTETVLAVLNDIRRDGDDAIRRYEEKFDHVVLDQLLVSEDEMQEAEQLVSADLKEALILAHRNIAKFHEAQRFEAIEVETAPGVRCWQKSMPIEKVGLYIPGGTAPLFSTVLMLATPAKIAGCKDIVLCSPPNRIGTEGLQDLRPGQPVCNGSQATSKPARCSYRHACRTVRSVCHRRRFQQCRIRCCRPSVASRTRHRLTSVAHHHK